MSEIIEFLQESNEIEDVFDNDALQQAIYAWEYLIEQKEMSINVMLKTHKILMLHQSELRPDEKGYFRRIQVWVGRHEGSNWKLVPTIMSNWVMNVNDAIKNGKNESIIWKEKIVKEHHIKAEKCHPFRDGNGRIFRMIMAWERIQLGLPILIIKANERGKYYEWFR